MSFSVVIPTFNRIDVLPEVLEALARQEGIDGDCPEFEVIVVDDGSSDGTGDWLAERSSEGSYTMPFRVFQQENQGPAVARNRGVSEATGERIAFLGDDTVPSPTWLANHERAVERRKSSGDEAVAVIGYTGWHPRMRLNPFLRYINEYGLQFGYEIIEDPDDVPFNFLYTSNLTLPRGLLLKELFDLRFPYAAWEDIELAYRLKKHGMRLIYEPAATVAHDHPTSIERFKSRQEKAGYSAVVFYHLHRELGPFLGLGEHGPPPLPSARRQKVRELVAGLSESLPLHLPKIWNELLRYHYIRGLHRGWKDREKFQTSPLSGE